MSIIDKKCIIGNKECSYYHARGYCMLHYNRFIRDGSLAIVVHKDMHGMWYTREYKAYNNMKTRCFNPKAKHWEHYGGRGITVCDGFLQSFSYFLKVLGYQPQGMTLDRKDVNANYSCGNCQDCKDNKWSLNCRWSNLNVQAWNVKKRKNNTSGFTGVVWNGNNWSAQMTTCTNGKRINWYITSSDDAELAAIEYDKAVIFFRGYDGLTNIL